LQPRGAKTMKVCAAVVLLLGLCCWSNYAHSQTEAECLQSFAVKQGNSVSYIASSMNGQIKAPATMSCLEAETFRERLYVGMDKGLYDSETVLRSRLTASKSALEKLEIDLKDAVDAAAVKAKLAAAGAIVYTPAAVASTVACISAVIDGAGVVACGPAAKNSLAATTAWVTLSSFTGDIAKLKANAQGEIQKIKSTINTVSQQLDATKTKNITENYSNLFVAICRAVKQQCL
jgi:hypothetical protein